MLIDFALGKLTINHFITFFKIAKRRFFNQGSQSGFNIKITKLIYF